MKLSLFLIFNSLILEHHFQKFHIFLKRPGQSLVLFTCKMAISNLGQLVNLITRWGQ